MENKSEQKKLPCGTPDAILFGVDILLLPLTTNFQLVSYDM